MAEGSEFEPSAGPAADGAGATGATGAVWDGGGGDSLTSTAVEVSGAVGAGVWVVSMSDVGSSVGVVGESAAGAGDGENVGWGAGTAEAWECGTAADDGVGAVGESCGCGAVGACVVGVRNAEEVTDGGGVESPAARREFLVEREVIGLPRPSRETKM